MCVVKPHKDKLLQCIVLEDQIGSMKDAGGVVGAADFDFGVTGSAQRVDSQGIFFGVEERLGLFEDRIELSGIEKSFEHTVLDALSIIQEEIGHFGSAFVVFDIVREEIKRNAHCLASFVPSMGSIDVFVDDGFFEGVDLGDDDLAWGGLMGCLCAAHTLFPEGQKTL